MDEQLTEQQQQANEMLLSQISRIRQVARDLDENEARVANGITHLMLSQMSDMFLTAYQYLNSKIIELESKINDKSIIVP